MFPAKIKKITPVPGDKVRPISPDTSDTVVQGCNSSFLGEYKFEDYTPGLVHDKNVRPYIK
jgi:hypothetical protein